MEMFANNAPLVLFARLVQSIFCRQLHSRSPHAFPAFCAIGFSPTSLAYIIIIETSLAYIIIIDNNLNSYMGQQANAFSSAVASFPGEQFVFALKA